VNAITPDIKTLWEKHGQFIKYLIISAIVTVVDICVCYGLEFLLVDMLAANAAGVVTGFVIQYFLVTKHVFVGRGRRPVIVFFLTFLIGLGLAEATVWIIRDLIFGGSEDIIAFAVAKGVSLVIPFFVTYTLRKKLM